MLKADFWQPNNFGALPQPYAEFERSRIAVLPIPYETTTSYLPGTRQGPQAIIAASSQVELYDEELETEPYQAGICTLNSLEPDLTSPQNMCKRIAGVAGWLAEQGKLPVALGGEHTVSIGMIEGLAPHYPGLSVLQLDAHADLRDEYQGSPYSHACALRRSREIVPVVQQVGIRNLSRPEADFVKANNLELYYASKLMGDSGWMAQVVDRLTDPVYITLDLDVFDPGIMPAVGTPEPGGLGWYQVLDLLRQVCMRRKVVGFDVVELAPLPGNPAPDFMAAKLIYKIIGYLQKGLAK